MNIILLENIEKVGFKDEIVTVKNGYGRNFLIPQGKAILATTSSVKVLEEKLRQQSTKEEKVIETANATAETLKGLDIKIKAKIAGGIKLFGKVTLAKFTGLRDVYYIDSENGNVISSISFHALGSAGVSIGADSYGEMTLFVPVGGSQLFGTRSGSLLAFGISDNIGNNSSFQSLRNTQTLFVIAIFVSVISLIFALVTRRIIR